jgi:Ankyrin repeats (3 copies)
MSAAGRAQIKAAATTYDLWQIAESGDLDQLRQVLSRGVDINAYNDSGMTALMVAAYHGRREMVSALLEHGAKPNAANDEGLTAAMLADDAGHEEIVRTLVALSIKRKPAAHVPEVPSTQFAERKASEVISNHADPPLQRAPGVRTLSEPPDIWDLVHETRTEFNPGSAFVGHLTSHPLILAVVLLIIVTGGLISFVTLRGVPVKDAVTPVRQSERSSPETILRPRATRSNRTMSSADKRDPSTPGSSPDAGKIKTASNAQTARPNRNTSSWDQQHISQFAGAETIVDSMTSDPKTAVADPVGLSGRHFSSRSRRQNPTGSTMLGSIPTDNDRVLSSNSTTNGSPTVVRTDTKDRAQTSTGSGSDNENRTNRTGTKKDPDKAQSPQSTSPARASATPKAKVIPWP